MLPDLGADQLIADRYRLERRLGEGGMGTVWAARRIETGEAVALKFPKRDAAGILDSVHKRRMLREARAAASVRHPNVVAIHEVLELDDGSPVVVMERLDGEPLSELLERERVLQPRAAALLLLPVVSAVGAAHAVGVVHRDLKPANIFLVAAAEWPPAVKVLDFGIAKLVTVDDRVAVETGLTTTGTLLGTPSYMAPEQLFGESDFDHRVDVWALGLIMYRCLSGVLPTAGEHVGSVLKKVLAEPIAPLATVAPGVPRELAELVDRMLSRRVDQRPSDLRGVSEVLRRYAGVDAPPLKVPSRTDAVGRTGPAPITPTMDATPPPQPSPSVPESPARRGPRRALAAAAVVAGVVALAGLTGARWWAARTAQTATVSGSPLGAPDARLACPILGADGVDEPSGWLGAAAAGTVCIRAELMLGGSSSRTLVPAELLDLPFSPVDDFPDDAFGGPDARDRSLAAAKARSAAYIDGHVTKLATGFRVLLSIHRAEGPELGRGAGEGRALYEAVREAMRPLQSAGWLPKATALEPSTAQWLRVRDVDAALAMLDMKIALAQNAGSLPDACAALDEVKGALAENWLSARITCARVLGRAPPEAEMASIEVSDAAALASATDQRLARQVLADPRAAADRLYQFFDKEPSRRGRATLALMASCASQASDPTRARELALLAVQADPKHYYGFACASWGQLLNIVLHTPAGEATARAHQAWQPWEARGWVQHALQAKDEPRALALARRAYVLAPLNTVVATALFDRLVHAGRREEARGVGLALSAGGQPVHSLGAALLLVRLDSSEAHFGAGRERALVALAPATDDSGYVKTQRLELAWRALDLALLSGGGAEIADRIVEKFVLVEPPPIDGMDPFAMQRIVAACVVASRTVSPRCFDRVRSMRRRAQFLSNLPDTDRWLDGAERYARGDHQGAVAAWRPLVRTPGFHAGTLSDAMATAFERTGDQDLAERLDVEAMARAPEYGGATTAHVRAARRAAKRGRRDEAAAHAKTVIEAWATADVTLPAVAEMRGLLASGGSRAPAR
jgi:tRNA A-37 threonylcarbamoyl transferase component Bud32